MAFPEGFWWGTGASSTQAEGAAPASDWLAWEQAGHAPPSGDGNGFATRYADDFAMYAEHGLTHHRISIEWARIEPEEGKRDQAAVEHYTRMLTAAHDAGISPWVCLHHFTLPRWFSEGKGGFLNEDSRKTYWGRHVDFIAETFGDLVFGWKPVNEPIAYSLIGWRVGAFPPGPGHEHDFPLALESIHLANVEAALRLRRTGKPVATIHNLMPIFPAVQDGESEPSAGAVAAAGVIDDLVWGCWLSLIRDERLTVFGRDPVEVPGASEAFDLIGFSYYFGVDIDADGRMLPHPKGAKVGLMNYVPWADGAGLVLDRLHAELPGRALLVDEYGMGTTDDTEREQYLRTGLAIAEDALAKGIDLRGFFHWTGVDNYEWNYGDRVPFGLWDRDRNAKPSSAIAAAVAKGGPVPR